MNAVKKLILSLVLMSTLAGLLFQTVAFNQSWYESEFEILAVPKNPETTYQLTNLLAYLKNTTGLDNAFYTEREILHLRDIRQLAERLQVTTWGLVILCVLGFTVVLVVQKGRELVKTVLWSNITALVLYSLALLLVYLSFDWIFLMFHQMAFSNDYWLLDPQTDNLVNLFPPPLFADLLKQVLGLALLLHLTLACLAGFVLVIAMVKESRKT